MTTKLFVSNQDSISYYNFINWVVNFFRKLNISEKSYQEYQSQKIWISVKRGVFESLEFEDIIHIQAADHYLKIHLCEKRLYVIKSSLKDFYKQYLSKYDMFYRLSRSYIVNLDMAHKIENNQLYLKEHTVLPIPKSKREEILKIVGVKI